MTTCAQCGKTFGNLTRVVKSNGYEFCSHTCRVAAYRDNQIALAQEAVELLAAPAAPANIRQLQAMAEAVDLRGSMWRERLNYVLKYRPRIVEVYGPGVLLAAAAPFSAGTCRWHPFVNDHVKRNAKLPRFTPGTRMLLGDPCTVCKAVIRKRQHSKPQSNSSGRSSAAGRSARATEGAGGNRGAGRDPRRGSSAYVASGVPATPRPGVCCETFAQTRQYHWKGCATKGQGTAVTSPRPLHATKR
jgi:hypothetical protein